MLSTKKSLLIDLNTPELLKLRSIVESGFTHDWVLRIEHSGGGCNAGASWVEWGKPAFAITSATQLLVDVAECRMNHPTHAIRITAEKFRPRARMLYCVYNAAEQATPAVQTVSVAVTRMQAANDRRGVVGLTDVAIKHPRQ